MIRSIPVMVVLCLPVYVAAETKIHEHGSDAPQWGIGLGVLSEDEGYINGDQEVNALPVLYFSSERFEWFGLKGAYHAYRTDNTQLDLRLETRIDGFEPEDSPFFEGMPERNGTFYAGPGFQWQWNGILFDIEMLSDIGSEHDGVRGGLELRRPLTTSWGVITPWVEFEYYSQKMTDYYFGVDVGESSHFGVYEADSAVNIDAGIDWQSVFSKHHIFILSAKYRQFDSTIENSPVVEEKGAPRLIAGYVYRF